MKSAVHRYLALRRALGHELEDAERLLRGFAEFAARRGERYVRSDTAVRWAGQVASQLRRDRRLRVIARFSRFIRAEDPRHQLPPADLFPWQRNRRVPYIYSDEEIAGIVREAARLEPAGSLRPLTFSTLFGLLAVTGIRISEALNLRLDDVRSDGLVIRETKFRKSRIVPLHPTTAAALDEYLGARGKVRTEDTHVFISLRGRGICYPTVRPVFNRLLGRLGIPQGIYPRGPRIHDLRHTFCVKALLRCPSDPRRVDQNMLAVSTYMGHTEPSSTFWYLQATPALLTGIAESCERFFKGARP